MSPDLALPEELVECLERYRDGRCPELAGGLLEELAVRSQAADCALERCTCFSLLRHWHGVDRARRTLPPPRLVPPLRLVPTSSRRVRDETRGAGS